ncbi:MAG: hypothetical protein KF696_15050 [Planctomycetes bacterium]|nr:hypothetical protein [Planctomycetota bacterium]MCW8135885.1 hypothetical protein [Planctomycetota bacterium]
MPINMTSARKLCTKAELELVQATAPAALKRLDAAGRKLHAARARKLLTKWRSLLRKQQRTSAAGKNTLAKIKLFEEVVKRFDAKPTPKVKVSSVADIRSGLPKGVKRPKAAKPARKSAAKGSPKVSSSESSKVQPSQREKGDDNPAHYNKIVGVQRPLSHVAARNRRSQARRDAKHFRSQG